MNQRIDKQGWERHWTEDVATYESNKDLKRLRPVLRSYMKGKIADIGCGVTNMYKPGDDVTGVDISEECVRIMSERYPFGTWIAADARHTTLPESAFDTVICSHVVEHFWDTTPVIEELKRICKKEGHIIVTVPRNSPGIDHVHPRWYPEKVEDMIARHLRDATYEHRARAHWLVHGKYAVDESKTGNS